MSDQVSDGDFPTARDFETVKVCEHGQIRDWGKVGGGEPEPCVPCGDRVVIPNRNTGVAHVVGCLISNSMGHHNSRCRGWAGPIDFDRGDLRPCQATGCRKGWAAAPPVPSDTPKEQR